MPLSQSTLILAYGDTDSDDRYKNDLAALVKQQFNIGTVLSWYGKDRERRELSENLTINETILILPVFMCEGFVMNKTIAEIRNAIPPHKQEAINYLAPIGTTIAFSEFILGRSVALSKKNDLDFGQTQLVVMAHGSRKFPQSAKATNHLVDLLTSKNVYAGIQGCYLEQSPQLSDVMETLNGPIIIEGLFLSDGNHLNEDYCNAVNSNNRDDIFTTPMGGLTSDPQFNDMIWHFEKCQKRTICHLVEGVQGFCFSPCFGFTYFKCIDKAEA
jgi:sirohydrochlorin ferrochelatase